MNMKYLLAAAVVSAGMFMSCDDDVSGIGGSLSQGEVTITVDSLVTEIPAASIRYESFDGRNTTKLLGRINVP